MEIFSLGPNKTVLLLRFPVASGLMGVLGKEPRKRPGPVEPLPKSDWFACVEMEGVLPLCVVKKTFSEIIV